MASKYTVVQFTPDPIADERVNIGVLVSSGDQVFARFLADWSRVKHFSGQDVSFLRHFAKSMTLGVSSQVVLEGLANCCVDEALLSQACSTWTNSIQFTPLRASLKDAEALLDEVSARFLLDPEHAKRAYRDRRAAASAAASKIRQALRERVGDDSAESLLKKRHRVTGKLQEHKFDAVVANGQDYLAAQGISFEVPLSTTLQREAEAVAWQITDVRASDPQLPIGIVALPPRSDTADYDKSRQLFEESIGVYRQIGAHVLDEDSVASWAGQCVAAMPFTH